MQMLAPAPGSVSVTYRALGRNYRITDNGDGTISGAGITQLVVLTLNRQYFSDPRLLDYRRLVIGVSDHDLVVFVIKVVGDDHFGQRRDFSDADSHV